MCGITGVVGGEPTRAAAVVEVLNERQRHRGPDHSVVVRAGPFTLGNTRLAIQDPTARGNQPFTSQEGRYTCVFNGEIYNFPELIDRFELRVPSHCDGAVIPELWARLGPDCLRELRGMYAIALVDLTANTLQLARDPYGVKPLYVRTMPDGSLVFASEVRALAELRPKAEVARTAVARFLHLGALPADTAPFESVACVPPNTVVTVTPDGTTTERPILDGAHPLVGSAPRLQSEVAEAFRESVRVHLRADVPTVLLLSSGVDSTAVAAVAAATGQRLHCMTVRGLGEEDEAVAAEHTARHYRHTHQVVEPSLTPPDVERFFAAMQRPTIDGLNTFVVCSTVKEAGYRVALSGLGADEALGGYRHYRVLRWLPLLGALDRAQPLASVAQRLVRAARRQDRGDKLVRLLAPEGPRTAVGIDLLQREVYTSEQVMSFTGVDPLAFVPQDDGSRSFTALVEAELTNYMQAMLLPDADAFSMCSSVELRVPFVDRSFFEAATGAVAASKRPGKAVLVDALGDAYLRETSRRPKRGFSVPMAAWMRSGPLRLLSADLDDPSAPVWAYVSRTAATGKAAPLGRRWSERWALVALNRWLLSVAAAQTAL